VGDSQREEEEEEEEEEEVVEEELDDNDRRDLSPSASPQNKQAVGCVFLVTLEYFGIHFLTFFCFFREARPQLPHECTLPRYRQLASLLLMAPNPPSRSAVQVALKALETENLVRALVLLASLSSLAILYRKVVRQYYQASPLKINSTTNFNGAY